MVPRTRCLGIHLSRSGWCLAAVPCCQVYCIIIVPDSQVLYSYFRYYFSRRQPLYALILLHYRHLSLFVGKFFGIFLKSFCTEHKKAPLPVLYMGMVYALVRFLDLGCLSRYWIIMCAACLLMLRCCCSANCRNSLYLSFGNTAQT